MRHVRRAAVAFVALVSVLTFSTSAVFAHAVLDNSVPASGATLVDAPPQIVLDFDEPVETSLGFIRLFGSDATRVPLPSIARDASDKSIVRVDVPTLDDDTYVVTYRVVSVDGHPVDGAITFQVGEGAPIDVTSVVADVLGDDGTDAVVSALTRVVRLAGYLALALVLATGLFLLGGVRKAATPWLLRVGAAAGGVMALAALGLLGLQGAGLAGGGVGSVLRWSTFSDIGDTRVGHALLVRAGVGGLVAGAAIVALRRSREVGSILRFALVTAFVVVPLSYAFAGHPGAASPMALAVAASTIHVLAIGTWFGGLIVLATSTQLREPVTVKWFSQRAAVLVGVAVVSGAAQSLIIVEDVGGILDITYGKTLAGKLVFVGIMLLGAAVVRRRFLDSGTQRLRPVLIGEAVAGLLVLSVTSGLVTETPRSVESAAPFATSLVQGDTIVNVTVSPARVGNVEMHVIISKPGGSLDPVATARVRFSSVERDVPAIAVEPAEVGPNHFVATAQIPYAGEWRIDVVIVEADGKESLVTTPFTVRP
jgi:copper transport protein